MNCKTNFRSLLKLWPLAEFSLELGKPHVIMTFIAKLLIWESQVAILLSK